ncbi:MAG: RNA polymerase sigma factor SigZ [Bacteroidales bacterium]|nr:RNA polymerase sigma factor SigZ [Bacteroidales bacterium]
MQQNIEKIWKQIHTELKTFIAKKVRESDDVEDIVHDTFVKMKLNIDKLKDPSKINAWVYQIARNNINDYYRAKSKYANHGTSEITEDKLIEEEEDEMKILLRTRQFSDYAASVINQLPEKYREAVFLADMEGMNQNELAQKLNLSISGAKSRVQRGRQKVKELVLLCCDVNTDVYGNIVDYAPRETTCKKKC